MAAALGAAALALLGGELALRFALFGPVDGFASLRRAGRYTAPLGDDDHWKLALRFEGERLLPERAHPELGWSGWFDGETYAHWDAQAVGGKRPVLLYGDSFSAGVPASRSFQEILNGDPGFAAEHHLLNYGVGGYGVDQSLLLLRRTVGLYEDPFVVFGLMTLDLDRGPLSVRPGQKPRFVLEDGELARDPTPIDPDPRRYHAEHPPRIRSYLWRGLLFSDLVPDGVRARLTGERARRERIRALNERLLRAAFDELRARDVDFVCLVFHPHVPGIATLDGEPDWREVFLRELLEREGVPVVWSKDCLPPRAPGEAFDPDRWIHRVDGHPTTAFNERIAERLRERVLVGS